LTLPASEMKIEIVTRSRVEGGFYRWAGNRGLEWQLGLQVADGVINLSISQTAGSYSRNKKEQGVRITGPRRLREISFI